MRCPFLLTSFIITTLLYSQFSYSQVAAVKFIVQVPKPDTDSHGVYLAGSFNGWSAHDSMYLMNKESETTYSLLVPLFEGKTYGYKYTRGNWNAVETKLNDSNTVNRLLYSQNGQTVRDTVLKWKMQGTQTPSPQMQAITAKGDSLKRQLQSTLNDLLVVLKNYNENMLSPHPSNRLHQQLNKQAIGIMAKLYRTIDSTVWDIGNSLSPEQKQKILDVIKNSGDSKDVLTTLGNAYGQVLK